MVVRRALLYSFGQRGIGFGLQLISTIILARLLTPSETGIFALAAAVVLVGQLLRDFGTSDYVIAMQDVSQEKLRAAFTVTLVIAWTIGLLLVLVARPVSSVYGEQGVAQVLRVLSFNFLLLPFGTVAHALLNKALRFKRIFWIQCTSALCGTGVTIATAWAGASYMSMAYGAVASNATLVLIMSVLPGGQVFLRPTTKGLREVFNFGGALTGARLIESLAFRSNDFAVAALLGFHAGGLLSKTNSLISSFHEVFNTAIVRVLTPAFAQSAGRLGDARAQYLQATELVACAQWLFFPALGIFAPEIVGILFGPIWTECVPLVRVGAASSLLWAPYMLSVPLLTAFGAVRDILRMQLIWAPTLALAIFIGANYSLMAVVVLSTLTVPLRLWLVDRALFFRCGIRFTQTMRQLIPSLGVASVAAVVGSAARLVMLHLQAPPIVTLIVGGGALAIAAIAAAMLVRHPLLLEVARVTQALKLRYRH